MKKDAAFTLIELLIVVAIIAILAAIAVPNFIEAQVRSKVSRAKADMRSIASAVETYAVDNNTYPLDADDHLEFNPMDPAWLALWNQRARFAILTTPIAYITSAPTDPFHATGAAPDMMTALLFPGPAPHTYAYLTNGDAAAHGGRPRSYGLISLGPNRIFDSASRGGLNDIYDATNGSVSRGDIIRYGP